MSRDRRLWLLLSGAIGLAAAIAALIWWNRDEPPASWRQAVRLVNDRRVFSLWKVKLLGVEGTCEPEREPKRLMEGGNREIFRFTADDPRPGAQQLIAKGDKCRIEIAISHYVAENEWDLDYVKTEQPWADNYLYLSAANWQGIAPAPENHDKFLVHY